MIFLMVFIVSCTITGLAQDNTIEVIMKTTKGDMTIELYADKAPITVNNFLAYVDSKFYDGTIFHRVIPYFMIQGGGLTEDFVEKPHNEMIQNEAHNGLSNLKYTIAMGRMSEPHTASAQFYINNTDNPSLDFKSKTAEGWGYCVFGKVTAGMEVVDAISSVRTMTKKGNRDAPRENIIIISVSRK